MDLIVFQSNVILVNCVPFLDADLLRSGASLGRNELLQVAYRVIVVALDSHLLPKPIVADNLQHCSPSGES